MSDQPISKDQEQAVQRIEDSTISAQDKESLIRFVRAFPQVSYLGYDDQRIEKIQVEKKLKLSSWLAEWLKALAIVAPNSLIWVLFSSFDHPVHGLEESANAWMMFRFKLNPNSDVDRVQWNGETMYLVAQNLDWPFSVLAVKASDEQDKKVYHFNVEDIESSGKLPSGAAQVIFNSLASLYDHVAALRVEDEDGNLIVHNRMANT